METITEANYISMGKYYFIYFVNILSFLVTCSPVRGERVTFCDNKSVNKSKGKGIESFFIRCKVKSFFSILTF